MPASIAPAALVAPLLYRFSKLFVRPWRLCVCCASDSKSVVGHRRDPGLLASYDLHQLHSPRLSLHAPAVKTCLYGPAGTGPPAHQAGLRSSSLAARPRAGGETAPQRLPSWWDEKNLNTGQQNGGAGSLAEGCPLGAREIPGSGGNPPRNPGRSTIFLLRRFNADLWWRGFLRRVGAVIGFVGAAC